jgi:predicted RNase H-like nuclease (RuvC/YqgF family)
MAGAVRIMEERVMSKPIDERLDALVHTAELLHADVQTLREQMAESKAISDRHEAELTRFRSAMRAALEAWLDENEPGDGAPGC